MIIEEEEHYFELAEGKVTLVYPIAPLNVHKEWQGKLKNYIETKERMRKLLK